MSNAYDYLSIVYDNLIDDVDYPLWQNRISALLEEYQINPLNALEIGAGTGNMTAFLIDKQIKVTALEPSLPMLSILQEKLSHKMGRLDCYNGSIFDFKSKKRYQMAFAFLDVLNYIQPAELALFFERVYEHLQVGAYFLFDYSTEYKLREVIGDSVFAEEHDDFAFIWENNYDSNDKVLAFNFTLFTEVEDNLYSKQSEQHRQYVQTKANLEEAFKAYFDCVAYLGEDMTAIAENDQRRHLLLKVRK